MTFARVKNHLPLILAVLLGIAALVLYLPSVNFDFITLDDGDYTFKNSLVHAGLSWRSVKEALTSIQLSTWIPVTFLSLMADVEFFGLGPATFHRTNVILHALNVLLLFVFLHRTTGSAWKSFFAAALWTTSPLRVESVAWIAERKDLLAGLFFLLSLISYGEYVKKRREVWYLAAIASMFLGLASKPIMVVLPPLLLILDFWPFERFEKGFESAKKLVIEKIPFFALAGVFSALTLYTQRKFINAPVDSGAVSRITDAASAYLIYLWQTLWPVEPAMWDKFSLPPLQGIRAAAASILILSATVLLWRGRKSCPAAFAGWGWYLIALFPVSGIVPVGLNYVADRYTYLPHMGIALLTVWGMDCLCTKREGLRKTALSALSIAIIGQTWVTASYLAKWKSPETLFSYQHSVTQSPFIEMMLATTHSNLGNNDKAIELLYDAIDKKPEFYMLPYSLGMALSKAGRKEEALDEYMQSYILNPESTDTHNAVSALALDLGRYDLARKHSLKALDLEPESWPSMFNLGVVELKSGNPGEALRLFGRAAELSTGNYDLLTKAGLALAESGHPGEAAVYFQKAVELIPADPNLNYNLAFALLESGQGEKAEKYFKAAIGFDPDRPDAHFVYGSWLESVGRRAEAESQYRELLRINSNDAGAHDALKRLGRGR